MRVTENMVWQSAASYLNRTRERLQRVQEQVASQRRILRPEDDPAGTERALLIRSTIRAYQSYKRSVDQGLARLTITESALQRATQALEDAVVTTMRLRSDTFSDAERESAALQVEGLLDSVLAAANTRYQDRYIFGGYQTNTPPFSMDETPSPSAVYSGDQGVVSLYVEPGRTVEIGLPGDTVFGDALEALIGLAEALRTPGADLGPCLDQLNAAVDTVLQAHTTIGQRLAILQDIDENLARVDILLQQQSSDIENLDLAEASVQLASEELAYNATLGMIARLPQPLLIEKLR